jgi:hypothetical protein
VNKNGAIGKKILDKYGKKSYSIPKPKSPSRPKSPPKGKSPTIPRPKSPPRGKPCKQVCLSNQICNPDTGRCVNKNGAIGKKILGESSYSPFKLKKTLSDGNCFYSAVYRSLVNKNLLDILYSCLPILKSSNEKEFIKKIRIFISIRGEKSLRELFQNFTKDKMNKDTFKEVIKYVGSIKNTLQKYYDNKLFKSENEDKFVDDIKKVILKDKNWVGNIEVNIIVTEFLNECNIIILLFNDLKNAKNIAIKDFDNGEFDNKVYLVNDREAHWEYIDKN